MSQNVKELAFYPYITEKHRENPLGSPSCKDSERQWIEYLTDSGWGGNQPKLSEVEVFLGGVGVSCEVLEKPGMYGRGTRLALNSEDGVLDGVILKSGFDASLAMKTLVPLRTVYSDAQYGRSRKVRELISDQEKMIDGSDYPFLSLILVLLELNGLEAAVGGNFDSNVIVYSGFLASFWNQ